jgi:hypothetical protein
MTLRPEYSLGHSAYNAFLHAEVGEELNGTRLTVLTALTRLGVDPWQEAARLADLPRDVAVTALAAALARLPEAIATRLAALLPGESAKPIAQPAQRRKAESAPAVAKPKTTLTTWLLWGVAGLALYFLFMQMQPARNLEPEMGQETTQS